MSTGNPYESPKSVDPIAQRGGLRTDSTSGKLTLVFGVVMVVFATFGLMIVGFQQAVFLVMPDVAQSSKGPTAMGGILAVHGVWLIYLPAMIAGGIVFAVAGYHVQRGSPLARRVAQANAIAGYIWVIAYSISCYRVSDVSSPPLDMLPESARLIFQGISVVLGALFAAAFPTGLLYVLSRPSRIARSEE